MRCIETQSATHAHTAYNDKLQHEMYWNEVMKCYGYLKKEINYNMRCIETQHHFEKRDNSER